MSKSTFWLYLTVAYGLLLGYAGFLYTSPVEIEMFGETSNAGELVFYALLFYTIASFRIVGPTELGAKLLFGKPLYEVSSGLVFVPLGIFQLVKETRLVVQDELPADPEFIFRNEDEEKVPPKFFPPIRIPFGPPPPNTVSNDPLEQRLTAEVVPIIRWKITDYLKFLTVIGNRKESRRQMTDATVAMFFLELTRITPAKALEDTGEINKKLKKAIIERVDSWGVQIENAQIKAINFSKKLNKAIQTIPEKKAKARATVITAEAEKEKRKLEGEGAGLAESATLKGRSSGLKHMADELGVHPSAALGADTARAITESPGQKTIIPGTGGFTNLVATAAAVGEAFRTTNEPARDNDTPEGDRTPEEDES